MDGYGYYYSQPYLPHPYPQSPLQESPLPPPAPPSVVPTPPAPQAPFVPPEEPSPAPQHEPSNPEPPSPSPPKKRRRGITDGERKALRDYFNEQSRSSGEKPSQKQLVSWFNSQFSHKISQSSISHILSPKHAHLDATEDLHVPQKMKKRSPDWPELEEALFEWQKILSSRGVTVSGAMLKEEAGRLWKQLPKYRGLDQPCWSSGWLHAFKTRYRITKYKKRISTKKVMALAAAKESEGAAA